MLAQSSDDAETDLLVNLASNDLHTKSRQAIRDLLLDLSQLNGGDPTIELRKWRLLLLEELLNSIPNDPTYGLTALTEFWQGFGFPQDSPHQVQGRGNEIPPSMYYQDQNLQQSIARHRAWIKMERLALDKQVT